MEWKAITVGRKWLWCPNMKAIVAINIEEMISLLEQKIIWQQVEVNEEMLA
jgi:hypothetical protein